MSIPEVNRSRRERIAAWFEQWITPRAADEGVALRERAVYALALPMIVLLLISLVVDTVFWLTRGGPALLAVGDLVGLLGFALAWTLARRGSVLASMLLLASVDLGLVAFFMVWEGYQSLNAMLLLLVVAAAGLTLGARGGMAAAALTCALYGLMAFAQERAWFTPVFALSAAENGLYFALVVFSLAGLTAIFGSWMYRAQRTQADVLQRQIAALQKADSEKDELLRTVRSQAAEQEALLARLKASDQTQARLATELRHASTPVIPVFNQVVVMPVVGQVEQTGQLTRALLDGVDRHKARLVLLDVTGVTQITEAIASDMLEAVDAAALLGAECVLVGIRPDVAHMMINLGIDLGQVISRRDLQSGIEYALGRVGTKIVAA